MIKVSVMYPRSDGATFDMEYYKTTHMEIVDRTMKPAKWEIDSGIDGPYLAIGHLYFESNDAMGAGLGAAGEATADVPNFTNTEAAFQISNVID
ncbi:MAG: EthD family reductase [Ilumatobacteraceae bacterium]